MSRASFYLVYRGRALDEHTMDTDVLGPALLAVGNMCREAHRTLNGDIGDAAVRVRGSFEEGCFQVDFELVQNLYQQAMTLIKDQDVRNAKEILEWIGILGGPATGLGLLGYLKWRRGRKIKNVVEVTDDDGKVRHRITLEDKSNVVILPSVYDLSKNPNVVKGAKGLVEPLKYKGVDSVEYGSNENVADIIKRDEAEHFGQYAEEADEDEDFEPQEVTAHLQVYSPVYDTAADRWRFRYGQDTIYADITETKIAENAIKRGGAFVGDTYKVRLQVTEHKTPKGQFRKSYKILEVLEFTPTVQQPDLFRFEADRGGEGEE